MSDLLAAAAAALGAPDHLVERAAQARAAADGTSYEDVLGAWGGGAPPPTPGPAAAAEPAQAAPPAATTPTPAVTSADPSPAAAVATLVEEVSAPLIAAPARSKQTPVLEGRRLHPLRAWLMMAGLFLLGLVITLIGPFNTGGDYRHLVPDPLLTDLGEHGRSIYLNQGCGYCHTQLVRPVLADVGLGPATETFADTLDASTFGVQRIGPDLAHIGARTSYGGSDDPVTADDFIALLTHPGDIFPDGIHPSYEHLADSDLAALAAYMLELR